MKPSSTAAKNVRFVGTRNGASAKQKRARAYPSPYKPALWIPTLAILIYALATLLIVSADVGAQSIAPETPPRTVTDDEVNALANRMYCPVCPNETLDACQTQACVNWREEIRTMLAGGASEQDVIDNFVARFGERVIGTPQDPLLRALALITPVVIAAIAVIVGVITFSRWQNQRQRGASLVDANAPPNDTDEHYRRAIEDDLL